MTKKRVLLFDFDGTLADSMARMIEVINVLALKYKYHPLERDVIEQMRGKSAKEVIKQLGVSKFKLPFIIREGRREFIKHTEKLTLFPQMKEVLTQLHKDYTLGIVTSNDAIQVKKFLAANNVSVFDFVYSEKNLFGKGKVIRHVIKKYHLDPKEVIYVGDEVRDIEAAREAGVRVVAVTWGLNSSELLKKHKPDFLVTTSQDLLKIRFV